MIMWILENKGILRKATTDVTGRACKYKTKD